MSDGDVLPLQPVASEDDEPGDEVEVLPRLRWSVRRRWAGAPERRSKALLVLLAVALALALAAGFVARGFISPAQVAARSGAPKPSLITQPVRYGVLPVIISMRAQIATGSTVPVNPPSDLGSTIAVVTSVDVRPGQRIGQGQLLFTVDQRPVFVFQGKIPVWRAMALGMHGPDIAQLQAGLAAAGFPTGGDAAGHYGPGTAAAVAALYRAHGLNPARSGFLARSGPAPTSSPGAGRTRRAAAAAEVPLGEVMFLPRLPTQVRSIDQLGTNVGSRKPVAQLGSGKVTLTGYIAPAQASQLQAGMRATAISDLSGRRFPVRVSSINGQRVVFVPVGKLPSGMTGQNVQVTLTASQVKSLIVPVAAVSTSGAGQTYVTVTTPGSSQTSQVPVRLGLSVGGEQAVTPVRPGSLRPGELVVLGISAPSGGGPGRRLHLGFSTRTGNIKVGS
jgi:peptidoglycan hydrolase-like protein with peptidoglycan-binding domain